MSLFASLFMSLFYMENIIKNIINSVRLGNFPWIFIKYARKEKALNHCNFNKFRAFILEATPRFELGNKGFADLCLTTWLWRHTWWLDQESNQGHEDFQSSALPTELSSHITWQRSTLPHSPPCSTIDAVELNFPVRNGKECFLYAIITRCYDSPNLRFG